jgi:hypothetical protein
LTGFTGNRWQCWEAYVRDQVEGPTWTEFMSAVVARNPALREDRFVFWAHKTYVLPQNAHGASYYLYARTDRAGRYAFADLTTAGDYELSVEAEGYHPHREPLQLHADTAREVTLVATGRRLVSHWEGYATASPRVRRLIDQALSMLGDDPAVYDALSPELRRLATGRYYADPRHFHHKDIVCADLIAICLHAAGVEYRWEVTTPPGTAYNTTHAANYYRPRSDHPKLRVVASDEAWRPGDILLYWRGNLSFSTVNHVNLYVGPFSGTDLSGNVHPRSAGYDVVNASIDHRNPSGIEVGTAIYPVTRHECLTTRLGYTHIMRVRHVDL